MAMGALGSVMSLRAMRAVEFVRGVASVRTMVLLVFSQFLFLLKIFLNGLGILSFLWLGFPHLCSGLSFLTFSLLFIFLQGACKSFHPTVGLYS